MTNEYSPPHPPPAAHGSAVFVISSTYRLNRSREEKFRPAFLPVRIPVHSGNGPQMQLRFRQIENDFSVFPEKAFVLKFYNLRKHRLILHMMPVKNGMQPPSNRCCCRSPGKSFRRRSYFPQNPVSDKFRYHLPVPNRVADIGSRYFNPCHYIRIHRPETLKIHRRMVLPPVPPVPCQAGFAFPHPSKAPVRRFFLNRKLPYLPLPFSAVPSPSVYCLPAVCRREVPQRQVLYLRLSRDAFCASRLLFYSSPRSTIFHLCSLYLLILLF